MTQWKLVPVEPTPEMIEAAFGAINYTMPEPSEDAGRVYSAMLSAAPSPDGEEVERVSKVIYEIIDRHQRYFGASFQMDGHLADECAAAAIAAMRPTETHVSTLEAGGVVFEKYAPLGKSVRPTLSEEDRATVEEMKEAWAIWKEANDSSGSTPNFIVIESIEDALSLINKLAGEV